VTYENIYEAIRDNYVSDGAWDRMLHAGDPAAFNLAEEAIGRHGDSTETALRIRDFETGADEAYSFEMLDNAANRAANFFEDVTAEGEIYGLLVPPRLELYGALFGGIKSKRIFVPLDTKFGPEAVTYRMDDAEATTIFTTDRYADAIEPGEISSLERIVVFGENPPDFNGVEVVPGGRLEDYSNGYDAKRVSPAEPYGIVYSSGTTGQPFPGLSPHATGVAIEPYLKFVVDLLPEDEYFAAASPAWSYGLTVGTLCPGLKGTNIGAYRGPFDLDMWLDTLERWGITNAMVAPTALRKLQAADVDPAAYDVDLRVLVTAGETLDAETTNWVQDALGTPPLDAYGLSEAGMLLCNYPFPDWEIKPGSMGKPLPGYDVRLMDPDTDVEATDENPAGEEEIDFIDETDEVGEICAFQSSGSGPLADVRPSGWQRTGDLAEIDEDGYWWYRGRADEVIISAGYRIGPEEIQATLRDHDVVEEAAVVGVDHETRGTAVKAFVTLAAGVEDSPELREQLIDYTKQELSKHEYPRELEVVEAFPRTASDKIDRRELERWHQDGLA
jgi:acetyl-CoA synthetase